MALGPRLFQKKFNDKIFCREKKYQENERSHDLLIGILSYDEVYLGCLPRTIEHGRLFSNYKQYVYMQVWNWQLHDYYVLIQIRYFMILIFSCGPRATYFIGPQGWFVKSTTRNAFTYICMSTKQNDRCHFTKCKRKGSKSQLHSCKCSRSSWILLLQKQSSSKYNPCRLTQ